MSRKKEWRRSYVVKAAAVGLVAFGALAGTATSAEAQGSKLTFTGSAVLGDYPPNTDYLLIDFLQGENQDTRDTPVGTVRTVGGSTGEFAASIAPGTSGTIQDILIGSSGVVGSFVNPDSLPIGNFLSIGSYTFSLAGSDAANPSSDLAFGPISLFQIGSNTSASFGIFGTVTGGGFTSPRQFEGLFTSQLIGTPEEIFATIQGGGTLTADSFSATFTVADAQVVPEPSTYILLATGLGALGLVGLRRRGTNQA